VSCNGGSNGSASVTASGGASGYTYSWSPSGGTAATATGLMAGAYTCTITDANGCTTTKAFTITQPTVLSASGSQTNVTCNGGSNGSASVTASGGASGYTYSWSPSGGTAATATGLMAGAYICTITDANGCTTTKAFTITQPTALLLNITKSNVTFYGGNDGYATVIVTGGTAPYSYEWQPNKGTTSSARNLSAGTYTITVTDSNGCIHSENVSINEPLPTFATTWPADVNGTSAVLHAVVNGFGVKTNVWFEYGVTPAYGSTISAEPDLLETIESVFVSRTLAGLKPNSVYHYRVVAENVAGTVYGDNVTFSTITTNVDKVGGDIVLIYPNPVSHLLYIESIGDNLPAIKLFNLQGMLILETKATTIDVSEFAPGAYLLEVNGKRFKLLKN
jgi:hypothetical protein